MKRMINHENEQTDASDASEDNDENDENYCMSLTQNYQNDKHGNET